MSKKNSRRQERNVAFQVLYALSFAEVNTLEDVRVAFCQFPDKDKELHKNAPVEEEKKISIKKHAATTQGHEPLPPTLPQGFAWELVLGVWKKSTELDALITRFSHNWRTDRMGRIELTILRLALYEMLYRDDIPSRVAINEGLEISRQFGEDNARSFVNGILDATAKALETGEIERNLCAT